MAKSDRKPPIYTLVDKWALPAVGACYVLTTLANALVHPIAEWMPALVSGALVGVAAYWMMHGILRFQKVNVLTMHRETYEGAVRFFFCCGLLFAGLMALGVAVGAGSNLWLLYGVAVPVGISAGAARQWELRECLRSKGAV